MSKGKKWVVAGLCVFMFVIGFLANYGISHWVGGTQTPTPAESKTPSSVPAVSTVSTPAPAESSAPKDPTAPLMEFTITKENRADVGLVPGEKEVEIPRTFEKGGIRYRVVGVESGALDGLEVESLTFPKGCDTFGSEVFQGNQTLKHIEIGEGMRSLSVASLVDAPRWKQ